jgi:hypothetical protein
MTSYRDDLAALYARAPRAKRLADDLLELSERARAAGDVVQAESVFWQADHLGTQAERGQEIAPDVEAEVRARYGLEERA